MGNSLTIPFYLPSASPRQLHIAMSTSTVGQILCLPRFTSRPYVPNSGTQDE